MESKVKKLLDVFDLLKELEETELVQLLVKSSKRIGGKLKEQEHQAHERKVQRNIEAIKEIIRL